MEKFSSIITVTGTKGKTTVVHAVEDVLRRLGQNTLKVDTTGHFVNGVRRSSLEDSKQTWQLVPTVCPGRYLWEFHADPELKRDGVAVLEAALGSSSGSGLGYRKHKVGVFLNVFEDHINSSPRIRSKDDIVQAKDFVFRWIRADGWAVFNADDEFVAKAVGSIPHGVNKLPVGVTFSQFDIDSHLREGGVAITVDSTGRYIVLKQGSETTVLADAAAIPWAFGGSFMPSVYNLLAAAGALYGYFDGRLPETIREVLESARLDRYGGRLTLLKNRDNVTVLADYAHEKVSLGRVGELARTMTSKDGQVIGVVRLAHDRTDQLIQDTAHAIAGAYDQFVVYDKIDGYWRKPTQAKNRRFPQKTGYVSDVFATALRSKNPRVERIVREDQAIQKAAELARPGDVVVVIVNDSIERSIGFIQQAFNAEFV
ncbi:hypothetical protein CR983_01845 [Candidatus Saccharibacteria bacterium]|nr:MAG: hypothetical protein CR983_01845 [Candidatus Saccharibacteria bacterium]